MSTPPCRLALTLATLLFPAALAAQRATLEKLVHQTTLDNGLQVVVLENHTVPLATIAVVVRAGAMTQAPEDQGVPHLFEHMLFKEYEGPRGQSFAEQIGDLHGAYNGATAEEQVSYYVTVPSDRADDAVSALARLIRDASFDDDALRTERFVVLGELQRDVSQPMFMLHDAVGQRLWGTAWPRKNVIGTVLSLMAVTPKQLDRIYKQWYIPNNAALIITGDVSAAQAFTMARKRFGGWKQRPDPFVASPIPPMPSLDSSRAVVLTGDLNDVSIEIAWQGPPAGTHLADTYAADALASLLNDRDGRFQNALVDSGLFHRASFEYQTLNHTGPMIFSGTTSLDKLAPALTVLATELSLLRHPEYFDSTEIEIARQRRAVGTELELEQGSQLAATLGDWWAITGIDYYLGYDDSLAARTPADLSAFVDRYITGKPFVIGAATTPAAGAGVAKMLQEYIGLTVDP